MATASIDRPRITVYAPELTPYTIKVTCALRFKGLPYQIEEPRSAEDYRRWSPENGLLPVIDVDGTRVQDSAAILDLIEERFPDPPLLARDPKVAREQRRLESWVTETFFFHMFRWVRSRLPSAEPGGDPRGLGPMARLGLIGPNGQVRPEVFEAREGEAGPAFDEALDELVKLLGDRPFFFAEALSRADLAAYGSLRGLKAERYPGSAKLLRARPTLWDHCERVEQETGGA